MIRGFWILRLLTSYGEILPYPKGNSMRDLITSGVKTAVQVAVAAVVAWLTKVGIDVDSVALEAVLFSVATGVVAVALNWVSVKLPVVGRILSLGLAKSGPSYSS
jgi:uncharacterized membrane protein (DUF441 family)